MPALPAQTKLKSAGKQLDAHGDDDVAGCDPQGAVTPGKSPRGWRRRRGGHRRPPRGGGYAWEQEDLDSAAGRSRDGEVTRPACRHLPLPVGEGQYAYQRGLGRGGSDGESKRELSVEDGRRIDRMGCLDRGAGGRGSQSFAPEARHGSVAFVGALPVCLLATGLDW